MEPMILPGDDIRTLSHAFVYALAMSDTARMFGSGPPACGVWLSTADDADQQARLFVALPMPDPAPVLDVGLVDVLPGLAKVIVWRYAEDAHSDGEVARFFERRDALEAKGVTLVDEIVVSMDGETLASLAIRSFTDQEGWNDMPGETL